MSESASREGGAEAEAEVAEALRDGRSWTKLIVFAAGCMRLFTAKYCHGKGYGTRNGFEV